jgi:hypothetical protein
MTFLNPSDYDPQIRPEVFATLIQQSKLTLPKAEIASQGEMSSRLRQRYDTPKIFINVPLYSATVAYVTGDSVYFNTATVGLAPTYEVFKAKSNTTNHAPTDTVYWELTDVRNPIIVMYLVDIVLYHLHASIPGRNVPQLRIDRYNNVMSWLNGIAEGIIDADLPVKDDDTGSPFFFGSMTRQDNSF